MPAYIDAWQPAATQPERIAEALRLCESGYWAFAQKALEGLYNEGYDRGLTSQKIADVLSNQGRQRDAIPWYARSLELEPCLYRSIENMIFYADCLPETTEAYATMLRHRWWHMFGEAAYAKRPTLTNTLDPNKRIRVGYLSGDWNFHSASIVSSGIISRHSAAIEAVCYSTLERHRYDGRTRRWQEAFGPRFVDLSGQIAHERALTIAADEVDILVDLSGYTNNNGLMTCASAPAPLRVQAWGYVMGCQSPMFTHLFADETVATPAIRATLTEQVVNLPAILAYLPPTQAEHGYPIDLGEPSDLPCWIEPPKFAVFQRAMKITEPTLAVWREILRRVPGSTIHFKGGDYTPYARERIADGLDDFRGRIEFNFNTSHPEHMLNYHRMDISLDTWPQCGGVSTLESLWMGVPMVTLIGPRMNQRPSASFMRLLGLDEFVAETEEQYIETAVRMVTTDRLKLEGVRKALRGLMANSPMVVGYVPAVEKAYQQMWREYCALASFKSKTVN